ncbi:hypothetical protein [Limisalsivibrio acetivorans]|uniref:hypothetical protein n=1 Tax=Limisalsivibrio acetivorans TaxID=1304888 RepID=UPI0003B4E94E|nr:hypothetical protein [Limisalsivibrio acetivorans]
MFLNRPDLILIALPSQIYIVYQQLKVNNTTNALKCLFVGSIPFIIWEFFSLVYYGLPLPNTAYAKLNTGLPKYELMKQGILYYIDVIQFDPFTIGVIITALIASIVSRSILHKLLSFGVLLYLLYILKIGGDFMSGRFFAVPFFATALVVSSFNYHRLKNINIFFFIILLFGLSSININSPKVMRNGLVTASKDNIRGTGIADERKYYSSRKRSLFASLSNNYGLNYKESVYDTNIGNSYANVHTRKAGIGFFGVWHGPEHYIIDKCGLVDPLLSKIPQDFNTNWRIGHFVRSLPYGYKESIQSNKNLIINDDLSEYYDTIRSITRGDVFTLERLKHILYLNIGLYNHYIEEYLKFNTYKIEYLETQKIDISKLQAPKRSGHIWNQNTVIIKPEHYLVINLNTAMSIKSFDISYDHTDLYTVIFVNKDKIVENVRVYGQYGSTGLNRKEVLFDNPVIADEVFIVPEDGDEKYSIGHFIIGNSGD